MILYPSSFKFPLCWLQLEIYLVYIYFIRYYYEIQKINNIVFLKITTKYKPIGIIKQ
ncbi:Hypothetical protein PAU_01188 [Photorhabdus asymbiotica]|uniref:Uncharacterized protein n=1 Tax=Photorhabdus asymbiotica subsp. asymbiotica (strain ATCC 43949 / 3105-77) TaxID=553480 RepID=B6VKF5_PHOAA|nr:Hypothetical protein PAU_01188 [Photorhabdus asymbiotica]CAR66635.1 Hypothetical protein PA-RVA2-4297 [Photorhabdus asymbiotica subsp. asymbiotica ATCC 43949]